MFGGGWWAVSGEWWVTSGVWCGALQHPRLLWDVREARLHGCPACGWYHLAQCRCKDT